VLLPLAAASVLIWSTSDREDRIDAVPVAIVNDDTIITEPQPMAAGRSLTAALTHPETPSRNLQWDLTDSDDATKGLASGRYYAVLTIPSDFSSSILSTGTDSPVQGTVTLVSNGAASTTMPWISAEVATAAASSLGQQVTQGYLTQVYDGFNSLAQGNQKAANSSAQLAQGVAQGVVVRREAVAQALDERTQRIDRQPGLVEAGRGREPLGVRIGHQVQHRQLPEADGVVGDDVGHRDARQLRPGPQHLLDLLGARLIARRRTDAEAVVAAAAGEVVGFGFLGPVLS